MERIVKVAFSCLLISTSILTFKHAHITTGGMTGLALNIAYFFNLPFDQVFFISNLPFYIFAIKSMGWNFALTSIMSILTVSLLTGMERFLPAFTISAWYGAIIGGVLMGVGLSLLFSSKASLGGTGVLLVYLQRRFGVDPGKLNFIFDGLIVASGIFVVSLQDTFYSAISIIIICSIISYFKKRIANTYNVPKSVPAVSVN